MTKPKQTYEQLIAYAAGDLAPDEAERIAEFLATDEQAARTVAAYRLAHERLAEDDSVAPPDAVIAEAKRIYSPDQVRKATPGPSWLERVDAVIAGVLFDSRLETVAVRRSLHGQSFQMAFRSEDIELDLTADRAGEAGAGWRLSGQISSEAGNLQADLAIVETGGGEVFVTDATDEHGYFEVSVPAGRYDLCMNLADRVFIAPELEIE